MFYIGCHLSPSAGLRSMGETALSIGATTLQFFTRNPRGSKAKPIDPADAAALLALCLWLVLTTGSGLFLLLGALWLAYRSLPPEVFLPRRLAKPTKNR